ncbi:MAG: transcriptional repressor [Alphaproteobacteria bacterium]|nr:transcriptional repressor [Alphaproteobacteria bacterium]
MPDRRPPDDHDHASCIEDALTEAETICAERGARLTDLRRRVLELVWTSHEPVGAYDILSSLGGDGRRAAPPTVYRALEFLLENGLIHRIESLNAFVGCPSPKAPHSGQFLLCTACGTATELTDGAIQSAVAQAADRIGFRTGHVTLEIKGLCRHCAGGAAAAPRAHAH